jgi:hypothetical protein
MFMRFGSWLDSRPVAVGAFQLGQRAVLEHLAGQRVLQAELVQHVGVGGVAGLGAADRRQLELLEQDLRELLR